MYFLLVYLIGFIGNNFAQHCRDNFNRPVAWWFIYKPPADVIPPYTGQNFSFVASNTDGKWIPSHLDFTEDNMIHHTLLPDKLSSNRISRAVAVFHSRLHKKGRTSARGVVVADEKGGFLLTHTVPELPRRFYHLPREQLAKGHLLSCISLDHYALNEVAKALKTIAPNFTLVTIPETLKELLPEWHFDNSPPSVNQEEPSVNYLLINDLAEPKMPVAALVTRPPGVKSCIYLAFAKNQKVMLNVYGQSESSYVTTVCHKYYGVRNLDSLCLKSKGYQKDFGNDVFYVVDSEDYSWFAVSTAASWQKLGSGPRQFWVCTSLVDKEIQGEGGMMMCIQNYELWVAFDNLKVAEPSCD